MKKYAAVAAVLIVALLVPASAGAKGTKITTRHYTGRVTPSGTVGFNYVRIKRPHKKTRFFAGAFNFTGVPVTCTEGPKTASGQVTFAAPIVGGQFTIQASNSASGSQLVIRGTVFGNGTGTIQLDGNLPIDPSGNGTNCHSGALNWTAAIG